MNPSEKKKYTDEEKKEILNKLNEKRLSAKKRAEVIRQQCTDKKIHLIHGKQYYKIVDLGKIHYVAVGSCIDITCTPSVISVYTLNYSTIEEKKGLIKIDPVTNKILVSYDTLRISYKVFHLEEI